MLCGILLPAHRRMFFIESIPDLLTFQLFFLTYQALYDIPHMNLLLILPRSYIREPMDLGTITTETKMCFYGTDHALFAKVTDNILFLIFIYRFYLLFHGFLPFDLTALPFLFLSQIENWKMNKKTHADINESKFMMEKLHFAESTTRVGQLSHLQQGHGI